MKSTLEKRTSLWRLSRNAGPSLELIELLPTKQRCVLRVHVSLLSRRQIVGASISIPTRNSSVQLQRVRYGVSCCVAGEISAARTATRERST